MAQNYTSITERNLVGGINKQAAEDAIPEGYVENALNVTVGVEGLMKKRPGFRTYLGHLPIRVAKVSWDHTIAAPGNNITFELTSSEHPNSDLDLTNVPSTALLIVGRTSTPLKQTNTISITTTATQVTATTATNPATLNIAANQKISGTGISAGTTIVSISGAGPYTITLSQSATASGTITATVETAYEFDSTYNYRYYTGFTANPRKTILANATGTLSYPQAEHGNLTKDLIVGLTTANPITKNNSVLLPTGVTINETTFDITVAYDNSTNLEQIPVFTYSLALTGITGSSYAAVYTPILSGGKYVISIPALTHNLNSYNIMARCYEGNGTGTLSEIMPNEVYINPSTGEVKLEFSEPLTNIRVLLHSANVGNQYIDAIAANKISVFSIPNLKNDFLFVDCFVIESATSWRKAIPTRIEVNATEKKVAVEFDNAVNAEDQVVLLWEYGVVKTTKFSVRSQTTLTSSGVDVEPELSVYGILADEVYDPAVEGQAYNAWVQHLDAYKTEGNTTLVAGMGWNLFRGMPRSVASQYLALPILYPSLRARAANTTTIAPAFHGEDQAVNRSRGAVRFTGGAEGWGQIESITWDQAAKAYAVKIPMPNLEYPIVGTPVQAFTDVQPFGDMLTIAGAELRSFDGEWPIVAKNPGVAIYVTFEPSPYVTFYIKTPFSSSDYNCGKAGEAGIFTDRLELVTTTPLLLTAGDQLTAQSFSSGTYLNFIGAYDQLTTRYVFAGNVVEESTLSVGQLLLVTRDAKYCFGLRSLDGASTGFDQSKNLVLVRGDSLNITNIPEPIEVKYVLAKEQTGLTLTVESGIGTLTSVTDARQFAIGQRVILTALGYYSGEYVVTGLGANNDSVTLDCAGVPDIVLASVTIPPHFELREAITFSDDFFSRNTFEVEGRWECIEQPQIDAANQAKYSLIEPTTTEHFNALDYGAQLPIRSTMSQDNLYFTNGIDPVQKYDGTAIYRASLPRWNAQLFMTQGGINGQLAAGTYAYYFRISAVDSNENVIITAVTGIADYKIEIESTHANKHLVHIRMIGFPNWDEYDFEKLSVEIYRTKCNLPGEYFFVARLEMPQIPAGGYLDYQDGRSDVELGLYSTDKFAQVTFGGLAAANTFTEPLRAKYITSIDNRIVLANLRDWQRAELNFSKLSANLKFADFVDKTLIIRNDSEELADSPVPTTTDMFNRVGFHFVGEGETLALTVVSYNSTTKILTCTITTAQVAQPGDWVYLALHGNLSTYYKLSGAGWWQIKTATQSTPTPGTLTITINMPNFYSDSTNTYEINRAVLAPAGTKHVPVYLDDDDNAWATVDGNVDNIITILQRLAAAVNCCMRQVDTSLNGYAGFKPWITADAGGDFPAGQINFVRPKESSAFFAVTLPTFTEASNVKVENLGQYVTGSVIAIQRRFPSRILPSYRGFPELFNRAADLVIESSTATELTPIDVNAADGQEITGILPFFSESAFGQSTREAVLIVFKSNSIYIVDLATKGTQKIESNGLGCTAPYSIAPTKDGIMFANESGIYKLTRQLTIEPVGQFVDRIWREEVELGQLALAHGHHFGVGRQYKLSVPLQDATENSDVLAYEHTRESRGQMGSWTRYTNHATTGWCNLFDQEFFATSQGRVCILKDSGTKWDFSDRGEAITSEITLRSNDFGISNVRKRLLHLSLHFRNPQDDGVNVSQESTEVTIASDLTEDFQACNKYVASGLFSKTGLSDSGLLKGETVRFSVPTSKAIRFQPKISNSGLYETLQISGVTYRVAGLTTKGTKEAKDSTD